MPKQKPARGPYLWLEPTRRDAAGRVTHHAAWVIRDRKHKRGTGCGQDDILGAEAKLASYIAAKHTAAISQGPRAASQIPVADVLNLFAQSERVERHARPGETLARLERLADFFGDRVLSDINGDLCRAYVKKRPKGAARRELEDLRAAINWHRQEGRCSEIIGVALPAAGEARDRWLTRDEAAGLIRAAWRYRETQRGHATDRRSRQHVAKFILVGLYTGTRSAAICGASFQRDAAHGWIDLERGVFYRKPKAKAKTKKQQPPVHLPDRLLAHMRRWRRHGAERPVEWNGQGVSKIVKAFRATAIAAGLPDVTPHTLRHTSATWLMQRGVDPWQAAGFLGMTVETLLAVYGHHHPDYQEEARQAFDRPRSPVSYRDNNRDNNRVTKREQTGVIVIENRPKPRRI